MLLLDRKSFPRNKPCAGALTIKALRRLRYSIAPVILDVARDLEVSFDLRRGRRVGRGDAIAAMTVRQDLDAFCLDRTRARGSAFRVIEAIEAIVPEQDRVTVTLESGEILDAAFLVGADGAGSRVARLTGAPGPPLALAVEGVVARSAVSGEVRMRFDFGCADGGYGWVFPKGDHVNVGLYTQKRGVTLRKADVIGYARRALGTDAVEQIVGHALGVGPREPRPHARVLLVGDAAGLVEPMLGEGLHNAILSGQFAATAILAALETGVPAAAAYRRALRGVRADIADSRRAASWFYPAKALGVSVLTCPPVRLALMRGFAAGKTLHEITRTAPLAPWYKIGEEAVLQI